MDEDDRRALSAMGFDPDVFGRNRERRGASFATLWAEFAEAARSGATGDLWEDRSALLGTPFRSPFPVEIVGGPDLDPLVFTAELARPATATEVDALTDWVAALGREGAQDVEDHVSFWSPASATTTQDAGLPAVAWWFDAAAASPRLVRRLVERTIEGLTEIGLPATLLFVGHDDA